MIQKNVKETIIKPDDMSMHEALQYLEITKKRNPDKEIETIVITIDGEHVNVDYDYEPVKFERIRRITGYLVGTLDRFNNAKRKEVEERVKHPIGNSDDADVLKEICD